jgi:hypothetical protein
MTISMTNEENTLRLGTLAMKETPAIRHTLYFTLCTLPFAPRPSPFAIPLFPPIFAALKN